MQHRSLNNYHSFWKRRKKIRLPYRRAVIILIVWITCLLFISLGVYLNHEQWYKKQQALENAANSLITQYHQTSVVFVGVLDSADMISRAGVTPYFAYLSAAQHKGVWLSTITIDLQNGSLHIEGNALNTSCENDFLHNLRAAISPFSGWKFVTASSNRSALQYYHFSLNAQPPVSTPPPGNGS